MSGTFTVQCRAASSCSRELSAQVGGTTVPGLFDTLNAGAGAQTIKTLTAAGIARNVPAGTHQVTLAQRLVNDPQNAGNLGDVRVVAIALG